MKIFLSLSLICFMASTNQVAAQEITSFPGGIGYAYYEDNTKISKKKVESLMLSDAKASEKWIQAKNHKKISAISAGAQLICLAWFVGAGITDGNEKIAVFGLFAATGVSWGYSMSYNKLRRESILTYNHNKDSAYL